MGIITLKNVRATSDITVKVRLKDGGLAIDWSGLSDVRAYIFSDAQKSMAGRCAVAVDQSDSTILVCDYSATKPQYLGVNRIVILAKYHGRMKTYDKAAFNIVPSTFESSGDVVLDDPVVDLELAVEDVSSSILDTILASCIEAAERATAAAEAAEHMVDINQGPPGDPGVGFDSVSSDQDGTLTILLSDGNTVTVNLNHDHPAYLKYHLCENEQEYEDIEVKDPTTLYLIPEEE